MMTKNLSNTDQLLLEFLERAKKLQASIELIKVLKSRTYKIGGANVLVRASSEGNRKYFFGINYITVEEIANLDNPFISFICGSVEKTVIIPAKILFKYLPQISHDRNGEYKINIDKDLNIVLAGRNNRIDCKDFINNWQNLLSPPIVYEEQKTLLKKACTPFYRVVYLKSAKLEDFKRTVQINQKPLMTKSYTRSPHWMLARNCNSQIIIY